MASVVVPLYENKLEEMIIRLYMVGNNLPPSCGLDEIVVYKYLAEKCNPQRATHRIRVRNASIIADTRMPAKRVKQALKTLRDLGILKTRRTGRASFHRLEWMGQESEPASEFWSATANGADREPTDGADVDSADGADGEPTTEGQGEGQGEGQVLARSRSTSGAQRSERAPVSASPKTFQHNTDIARVCSALPALERAALHSATSTASGVFFRLEFEELREVGRILVDQGSDDAADHVERLIKQRKTTGRRVR
ncbi:MAG: hypothetical protein AAF918_17000 [Pseudomonadota bacterium]